MRNSFHETPRSPSKAIMLRSGWGILWSSQTQCTAVLYNSFPISTDSRHQQYPSYNRLQLPASFTYQVPMCNYNHLSDTSFFFLCTFPQLPFTPGPTAVCLLRLSKYCKYGRVAPVVVAVEESILWINHPDRKGLAGVRKGLGH